MVQNKVAAASLDWALKHLELEGDGDLFPRPFELALIKSNWTTVRTLLEATDLSTYQWRPMRRVLVPKDALSFRRACQLDPIDALFFNAMTYEIGAQIEARRRPIAELTVFSYRFAPDPSGTMFASGNPWHAFWMNCLAKSVATPSTPDKPGAVAVLDITDFYNQIYHHPLENQLKESGVPGAFSTALLNLVEQSSEGVSRGIPTGPHASNLLAEMVLIPLDEYLNLKGLSFCRFVDDIFIFCASKEMAQNAIFEVADYTLTSRRLKSSIQPPSRVVLTRCWSITRSIVKRRKFSRLSAGMEVHIIGYGCPPWTPTISRSSVRLRSTR